MHEPNRCSVPGRGVASCRGRAGCRLRGVAAGGRDGCAAHPRRPSGRFFSNIRGGVTRQEIGRFEAWIRRCQPGPSTDRASDSETQARNGPPFLSNNTPTNIREVLGMSTGTIDAAWRVPAGMSTAPATADREFIPRGARLGMESVARAVGGHVVANFQAKLRSQDRREIQELLVADDRATQVVDADERAQPGA